MAKLHELLAAEGSAKTQAEKCRTDLLATFDKKKHLFGEKRVTFTPYAEGAQPTVEAQSDIQTSVQQELRWIGGHWAKALDLAFQIAVTNTEARADVVLDDGTVLLRDVPATALLELEKRAGEIHALASAIPTLDPAAGFRPDPARPDGVYVAREVVKRRTQKQQKALVLYHATEHHPAQTQLITEDVAIGEIREQEWSALITPAQKAEILDRAERLRRAFKTARSRANDIEAKRVSCGAEVFGYVFGEKK